MKLTNIESVTLMQRSCAIHGITLPALKRLLESKSKSDSDKADAVAKTLSQLKSMQIAKKTELRSDKESRGLVKALASKLTPYEEYIAQTKHPESMKACDWVKRIFQRGKVSQAEAIALLSNSCISSMKELDPYQVERVQLCSDEYTSRSAGLFCKRFNLN